MKKFILLFLCFVLLFFFGANLEQHQKWGMPIILELQKFRNPFLDIIMRIASLLGFELLVLLVPILSWTSRKNLIVLGIKVTHIAIFGLYIVSILKNYFKELRPFQMNNTIKGDYSGSMEYSFPSGHTWCSTIVWIVFGSFLSEYYSQKLLIYLFVSFSSFFVGFSRVYFGVHYPHDVLAGFVGAIFTFILHSLIFDLSTGKSKRKGFKKLFNSTFLMTLIGYMLNIFFFSQEVVSSHIGLFGVPGILFGLWLIEEIFEFEQDHDHLQISLWKRVLIGSGVVLVFLVVVLISNNLIRAFMSSLGIVWIHYISPKLFQYLKI